jgi:hypothetical protein
VPAVRLSPALLTTEGLDHAACWPEPLRSCVGAPIYVDRIAERGGWDGYVIGYETRPGIPPEAAAQAAELLATFRRLCAPPEERDLARELCRLRSTVAARAEDELDWQFKLGVYLDELAGYPADIVVQVLRYWSRNEKWWPTWAELHGLLERRIRSRAACLDALAKTAGAPPTVAGEDRPVGSTPCV